MSLYLEISKISPEKIIWVDEAGIDEIIYRPYARTDQGKRAYSDITGQRVSRTTIISGYCNGKLKSPMRFKGYTDKYVVNSWCEQLLSKEFVLILIYSKIRILILRATITCYIL